MNTIRDSLRELARRRAGRVADLAFLADYASDEVVEVLAEVLGSYRPRDARALLQRLCQHPSAAAREAGARSLISILKHDVLVYRHQFRDDPIVYAVLQEYAATVEP